MSVVRAGMMVGLVGLVAATSACWQGPRECAVEADCFLGEVCASGQCIFVEEKAPLVCDEGRTLECDRTCVDPQTSLAHCGACGQACAEGQYCSEGACVEPDGCAVIEARAKLSADADSSLTSDELRIEPLGTVQLDASNVPLAGEEPGDLRGIEWTLVSKPTGSSASLRPRANVATPTFFADVAGTYVFELSASVRGSGEACQPARVWIEAVPPRGIWSELTWVTPADPNPNDDRTGDLDLHYTHPDATWNREPYDTFWFNPNPDWGDGGDPVFLVSDEQAAGLETIHHPDPEWLTYGIGVHYYDDRQAGPSEANVSIYYNGRLALELEGRELSATGAFWHVAEIDAENGNVDTIDALLGDFPN